MSSNRATLHELQSVYGTRDLYDMLEIISVDAHNVRVVRARDNPT